MKTRSYGVRLEPTAVELVKKIAQQRNISVADYVREAVCEKLLREIDREKEGEGE